VIILAGGLGYEVLVPPAILAGLPAEAGAAVSMVVYYYLQIDASRAAPVMIGFRRTEERDFFESFIQVAGLGPRTAAKAIALPVAQIAAAIEAGDMRVLIGLPGVGKQKAREIVAKLQGKMAAYLHLDGEVAVPAAVRPGGQNLEDETLAALMPLGYTKGDAQQMIKRAMAQAPTPSNTEELLAAIFRQTR
jgi:Holliday junction DNA helicase RuvA